MDTPQVTNTQPAPPALTQEAVSLATAQATLDALRAIAANQPRRRKGVHEVVLNTPFWDGVSPRSVLTRTFYQNGAPVNDHVLTNEEIDLINQLKPGLYHKKKWRVSREGTEGIGLWYDSKTLQQRFDIAGAAKGRGLAGILQDILLEREEQDARLKARGSRYDEDEE